MAVRENCVPRLVAVTDAPGTAAPELSLTLPRIVPVATWASTETLTAKESGAARANASARAAAPAVQFAKCRYSVPVTLTLLTKDAGLGTASEYARAVIYDLLCGKAGRRTACDRYDRYRERVDRGHYRPFELVMMPSSKTTSALVSATAA